MKNRILLKEIPSGKFHSAIFTTYSINLYYLEQQVLPMLVSKNIHYVSILCDSNMLASQLQAYCLYSEQKKRNYAFQGIESKGAFHPKIIFLAGDSSILILIGSGNLTTTGHGKNLEIWNSVYIDSARDSKLGFGIQVWNYLKELHEDLGASAQNKLKSISINCSLLANTDEIKFFDSYGIDKENKISFLNSQSGRSIFQQLSDIIDIERIEKITIMSPYFDTNGKFLTELNKRYNPKSINILIQENFGTLPYKLKPMDNLYFFDWLGSQRERVKQKYFHAKIMIFEGKKSNYFVTGSANASMAAFGGAMSNGLNHESSIVYQSKNTKYIEWLALDPKSKPVKLTDYISISDESITVPNIEKFDFFIKSIERSYDRITVLIRSKLKIEGVKLCLYNSASELECEIEILVDIGDSSSEHNIPNGISVMYAELHLKNRRQSNKQFITDIDAFEATNPSPKNRALNQVKKLVEIGNFSTQKIIDYLNTLYSHGKRIKTFESIGSKVDKNIDRDEVKDDEGDLIYMNYSEIHERAKQIDNLLKVSHYMDYQSVKLWDSIAAYLKESREKELQAKIDEEETEDVNKSTGRLEETEKSERKPISKMSFEKQKAKVIKFLDNYLEIIESKMETQSANKPTLIDLSMFLIVLEILLDLICRKEKVETESKEKNILHLSFSISSISWSEYLLKVIGTFSLWNVKKDGFASIDNKDYELKFENYKIAAFHTCVSSLAVYKLINIAENRSNILQWLNLSLLNSNLIFKNDNYELSGIEKFIEFIPKNVLDFLGEDIVKEEILESLHWFNSQKIREHNVRVGHICYTKNIGYCFANKKIGKSEDFYQLFHPGFEWNDKIRNFWNGAVYSIRHDRWYKLK